MKPTLIAVPASFLPVAVFAIAAYWPMIATILPTESIATFVLHAIGGGLMATFIMWALKGVIVDAVREAREG